MTENSSFAKLCRRLGRPLSLGCTWRRRRTIPRTQQRTGNKDGVTDVNVGGPEYVTAIKLEDSVCQNQAEATESLRHSRNLSADYRTDVYPAGASAPGLVMIRCF